VDDAVEPIVEVEGGVVVAIDDVVEDGAVLLRVASLRSHALSMKAAATAAATAGTLVEKLLSMSFSLCVD